MDAARTGSWFNGNDQKALALRWSNAFGLAPGSNPGATIHRTQDRTDPGRIRRKVATHV